MRKRPFLLFCCTLLFSYFPLEMFHHYTQGLELTPVDWILSGVLPAVLIYGLLKVSKLGWYTLVMMVTLLGIRDLRGYYMANGAQAQLFIHILIYAVSVTYFINPRIRHLYFDPKLRWWRVKRRYETHIPFLMNHGSGWHYPILKNISEGGCFIESPHSIDVSESVDIAIPLPFPLGVSVLKTQGEIRWVSTHPQRRGMGIQFKNVEPRYHKALKDFAAKHA